MATLLSVNVGLPKEIEWRGERVFTAIWKQPVSGARIVRRLNVDGDGQGDLAGHGGEHRAVFVYQRSSYEFWERELDRSDFTTGQFGENFTVDGLPDDEVCIGDRFRIGEALFEVTQPRVTCYRVGIRMNDAKMPARLVAAGRPGFYLRVLHEGRVAPGDAIEVLHRDADGVTVAEIDALLYRGLRDRALVTRALRSSALSQGWRSSLEAILAGPEDGVGSPGLTSAGAAPAQAGFRPVTITALERTATNVFAVTLEPADGKPLAVALPGQFAVVQIKDRSSDAPIVRSYSLCNAPSEKQYQFGIKPEPAGPMGRFLAETARVGEVIETSSPRGSFVLRKTDAPVAFVSAGIGVTPVLAMLRALANERSQRDVWWIFGARNRAEHPFADDSSELVRALPNARSHVRYSSPERADRGGLDYDAAGRLDAGVLVQLGVPLHSEFYLCGPPGFLTEMRAGLVAAGVSNDLIFSELFGSDGAFRPGIVGTQHDTPHAPPGKPGNGPAVTFARSGLQLPWDATYASLLDFADACAVPTRWSCRAGVCHSCETGLIAGAISYDPEPLQPAAPGGILLCCSTPSTEITLDL
jgi:ferredoxin-NADP reductase/MOSC domain-containing protein YiiM